MKAPKFEEYKIRKNIDVYGINFSFNRDILNDFKEPTGEVKTTQVKGIYHTSSSHITVVGSEDSSIQTKDSPAILILYNPEIDIKQNDWVEYNGKKYIVTGVNNWYEWNIALDISLEVVV